MISQKASLIGHAEFTLVTTDLNESTIPSRPVRNYVPHLFLLCTDNVSFFIVEKSLRERMINEVLVCLLNQRGICLGIERFVCLGIS